MLLGALTLLPAAVEAPAPSTTVAGAVTGVYGLAVLLGLAAGRAALAGLADPPRLIVLGAPAAALGLRLLRDLAGARWPRVVVAILLGIGVGGDALVAADLGDRGAARRPGPPWCRCSPASLFVGSAVAAAVVAGLAGRPAGSALVVRRLTAGRSP